MKFLKKIGMAAAGVVVTVSSANVFAMTGDTAAAPTAWHTVDKVTKVTVRGDYFMVEGTNPSGYACVSESNFYGTLNHHASEAGHNAYYAMALTAQTTGKGMACYVYTVRSTGVCVMANCYTP